MPVPMASTMIIMVVITRMAMAMIAAMTAGTMIAAMVSRAMIFITPATMITMIKVPIIMPVARACMPMIAIPGIPAITNHRLTGAAPI